MSAGRGTAPQSWEPMLEWLIDRDPSVRALAAWSLSEIGEARAVPMLSERLFDRDAVVRQVAAVALGQIGDRRALAGLVHLLADQSAAVRQAAAAALGAIAPALAGPALRRCLTDPDQAVRLAASEALNPSDSQAPPQAEEQVRSAPFAISSESIDEVIKRLSGNDPTARLNAIVSIGERGDQRGIPHLLVLLDGNDDQLSQAAARALGRIGAAALPDLHKRLADWDWAVRRNAAEALGGTGEPGAIPALLARFEDKDWSVRRAALLAIRRIGGAGLIPLLQTLNDSDATMRQAALTALGALGEARAIQPVRSRLADPELRVRQAAAAALARLAMSQGRRDPSTNASTSLPSLREAVLPLADCLADDSPTVRAAAATALGHIGDTAALPALLRRLADPEATVRSATAEALGRLAQSASVPGLRALLADSQSEVRQAAVAALGSIGQTTALPDLIERLTDREWPVRLMAALSLARVGTPALEALRSAISHSGQAGAMIPADTEALGLTGRAADEALADAVAWTIGQSGASALPVMTDWLAAAEPAIRRVALLAFGRLGDLSAVPLVAARLADPASVIRLSAVRALGWLGPPAAAEVVQRLTDLEPEVRAAAAAALGRIGDPGVVTSLAGGLKDPAMVMRRATAIALGQLGDERATEPLLERLGDGDLLVRQAAIEALGAIGQPRAVPRLLERLTDRDPAIAAAVAVTLGRIGDRRAILPLAKLMEQAAIGPRHAAAWALSRLGSPALAPVIEALSARDAATRRIAVEVIGQIADPMALAALFGRLDDEEPSVRAAVVWALGRIGDPAVMPILQRRKVTDSDPEVQRAVTLVHARLKEPRPVAQVIARLPDRSPPGQPPATDRPTTRPHSLDSAHPPRPPASLAPIPVIARVLTAAAPSIVDLSATATVSYSLGGGAALYYGVESDQPGEATGQSIRVLVTVTAPDFEIVSAPARPAAEPLEIELPLGNDAPPVQGSLQLRPLRPTNAPSRILLTVRYRGIVVGAVTLSTRIESTSWTRRTLTRLQSGPRPVSIATGRADTTQVWGDLPAPTDLTLTVMATGAGQDFELVVDTPAGAGETLGRLALATATGRIGEDQLQRFQALRHRSPEQRRAEIDQLGRELWRLLPAEFQRFYWARMAGRVTSLAIISDDLYFPWELVKPESDTLPDEHGLLGQTIRLGRWKIGHPPPPAVVPAPRLTIVAPPVDARTVGSAESDRLAAIYQVQRVDSRAPAVLALLEKGPLPALHLTGHGTFDPDRPAESQWQLSDRALTPADLERAEALRLGRPFVFLNSQMADASAPGLTRIGGWAAVLAELNCAACVGPYWSVDGPVATKAAQLFYAGVASGWTVGQALQELRRRFFDDDEFAGEPDWLAYTLHGHPNLTMRLH